MNRAGRRDLLELGKLRICRGCGCDDNHACITDDGPCAWALIDLVTPTGVCTACAMELAWHPIVLLNVGREDEPELLRAAGGYR